MSKKNNYLDDYGILARTHYDYRNKSANIQQKIKYMLARTQEMFKYTGLPDTIPSRDLELIEQTQGFACIAEVNGKLYAFFGGLGGEPNEYYMPTICTVANPALNISKEFKINEDCVIIPSDSMYTGLLPMMSYYAGLLTENELSLYVAEINTRLMALISATDDRYQKAGEQFFNNLEAGKLGFVAEKAFQDGISTQPYGSSANTNTIQDLITAEQFIEGKFYNEIGIDAITNLKRTVTTSDELSKNKQALVSLANNMLKSRKEGWDKVNKMFGTNVTVELSDVWKVNTEQELETSTFSEDKKEEQEKVKDTETVEDVKEGEEDGNA